MTGGLQPCRNTVRPEIEVFHATVMGRPMEGGWEVLERPSSLLRVGESREVQACCLS
jgi:hypothetical protein